jgi:CDP-diacylglycerol--glycerol-3-phosphate 3-phosphatidyltransferase
MNEAVGESVANPPAAGGADAVRAPSLVNAANALTLLRIILVPVFVIFMITSQMSSPGYRVAAALAFGVASLTDFADGRLARAMNQVTAFGKVADPIADKALIGTAFVLLSVYHAVPWWVTSIVLVREFGVTALRFWVIRFGIIPASRGGKAKTVLQILAITWYILPWSGVLAAIGLWIMAVAVVVTVLTGGDYVIRALRVRRKAVRR